LAAWIAARVVFVAEGDLPDHAAVHRADQVEQLLAVRREELAGDVVAGYLAHVFSLIIIRH
jgi:hypothetical protein